MPRLVLQTCDHRILARRHNEMDTLFLARPFVLTSNDTSKVTWYWQLHVMCMWLLAQRSSFSPHHKRDKHCKHLFRRRNIVSAFRFVLVHGATKPLPGWAVRIYRLHHLDVCHCRPLATSNSICVTCVWNSLSIELLDARPPDITLLYSLLSSALLSRCSICTIAPFFRHSLFWGPCFCHSQQPDEKWVSCHWARLRRWRTRSDACM